MSTSSRTAARGTRVAFCGLGRMGKPMARRISEAGFPLTVWNVDPAPAEALGSETGAFVAHTPAQAATDADIVVTMLVNPQVLLEVLQGPDGVLAGMKPGAVLVDCSTIGAAAATEVDALCKRHGVRFVASPVSGSTSLATEGQLALMIGSDEQDAVNAALPVLESFSKSAVEMGSAEAAAATKVAINALLHTFNTGLAEIVVVTERAGVERRRLFDALAGSVLANPYLDYKRTNYENPGTATVAFNLQTALKDVGLAADAALSAGVRKPLIAAVLDVHDRACDAGFAQQDMSALADFLEQADPQSPRTLNA